MAKQRYDNDNNRGTISEMSIFWQQVKTTKCLYNPYFNSTNRKYNLDYSATVVCYPNNC